MVPLNDAVYSAIGEFCAFHEFLCFSGVCSCARHSGIQRRFAYDCWASQVRFGIEHEVLGSPESEDNLNDWVPDFWEVWSSGKELFEN